MANTKYNFRHNRRARGVDRDASPVRTTDSLAPVPRSHTPAPEEEDVTDTEIDTLLAKHTASENYEAIATLVQKCCALDTVAIEIVDRLRYVLVPHGTLKDSAIWSTLTVPHPDIRKRTRNALQWLSEFCETKLKRVLEKTEKLIVRYGNSEANYLNYSAGMPFPNVYLTKWIGTAPELIVPPRLFRSRYAMDLIASHHHYIIYNKTYIRTYHFVYPRALAEHCARSAGLKDVQNLIVAEHSVFTECYHEDAPTETGCTHWLALEGANEGLHYSTSADCTLVTWPEPTQTPPKKRDRTQGSLVA